MCLMCLMGLHLLVRPGGEHTQQFDTRGKYDG